MSRSNAETKYRGFPIGGVNHWHDVSIPLLGRDDIVPGVSGREALMVALSFCRLLGLGCPKQAIAKVATLLLVWTGQRLEIFPELDSNQFSFICHMQQQAGPKHMVLAMPKKERDLAVAAIRGWDNPLQSAGEFSVYWIYEDFTRVYTRSPENEWPCHDVGLAVSDLMFSNWSKSQNIRNHGGAVSKACTFLKTEMCFFVWVRNCLRPLGNIESEEIEKMKAYLSEEG